MNRRTGATMILTSHHNESTLRIADHLVLLHEARAIEGAPRGLLASRDPRVAAFFVDVDAAAVDTVMAGRMPFEERGADELLQRTRAEGTFRASTDPAVIGAADVVIVVVGTPVDEHLNPDPQAVPRAIEQLSNQLRDDQLLILRSTVYPGVTRLVEKLIAGLGRDIDVAFCPERIAEGRALVELYDTYTRRLGRQFGWVARPDFIAAVATLLGVTVFGTLPGLFIGIGISLLLLVYRASRPYVAELGRTSGPEAAYRDIAIHDDAQPPDGIVILRIESGLYFANAEAVRSRIVDAGRRMAPALGIDERTEDLYWPCVAAAALFAGVGLVFLREPGELWIQAVGATLALFAVARVLW